MIKYPDAGQECLQCNRLNKKGSLRTSRHFKQKHKKEQGIWNPYREVYERGFIEKKEQIQKQSSKTQRQQWWNNLTPDEKEAQIQKWQAQKAKAKRREIQPLKEILEFNPKYPWITEGVNDINRAEWHTMILGKNPWLKVA